MFRHHLLSFTAASGLLFLPVTAFSQGAVAAEAEDESALLAQDVQWLLRNSYSLHHHSLDGQLRTGSQRVPFRLTLGDGLVRFRFFDPAQVIHLELEEGGGELREVEVGKPTAAVPASRYAEKVRGTEVCYEDLAMRFLYWPNPDMVGEERVRTRPTWHIRVYNPNDLGPYHAVDVWVDKESGGMLMMRGFDYDGKMIREFRVNSGQKLASGEWVLKQMRIDTFEPGDNRPSGSTYMEIDKESSVPE